MNNRKRGLDSIHEVDLNRTPLNRFFWFILGFSIMVIGLIGIIIPGLPTTPLMILAAACFAKSSQKFYDWIIISNANLWFILCS